MGVVGEARGAGLLRFVLHEEDLSAEHEGHLFAVGRDGVVAEAVGHLHLFGGVEPVVGRNGNVQRARLAAVFNQVDVGLPLDGDDRPVLARAEAPHVVVVERGDGLGRPVGRALVGEGEPVNVVGAALLAHVQQRARAGPDRRVVVARVGGHLRVRVVFGVVDPHVAVGRALVALLGDVVVPALEGDEAAVGRHAGRAAHGVESPVGRAAVPVHRVDFVRPLGLCVGASRGKEELPVRGPPPDGVARGVVCEARRRAAGGVHHVQVVVAKAVAREGDPVAVGAPAGLPLVGLMDREALGRTAVDGDGPEVPLIGKGDPVAVRVHGRVAHERIGVLGRGRRDDEEKPKKRESKGAQGGSHRGEEGQVETERHAESGGTPSGKKEAAEQNF